MLPIDEVYNSSRESSELPSRRGSTARHNRNRQDSFRTDDSMKQTIRTRDGQPAADMEFDDEEYDSNQNSYTDFGHRLRSLSDAARRRSQQADEYDDLSLSMTECQEEVNDMLHGIIEDQS